MRLLEAGGADTRRRIPATLPRLFKAEVDTEQPVTAERVQVALGGARRPAR